MTTLAIGDRKIGPGQPCFVLAEAGVNHNGHVGLALKLVDAAADAGADAVKFQTYKADRLVSPDAPKAAYQVRATGGGESQFEMLRRLELSEKAHWKILAHARERGILMLSTPFDAESADFLDRLGLAAFKIGSGEITNLPLLAHIAAKGKPVILSTGMSWLAEVAEAVRTVREAGARDLVLLHCVSNYPADPRDVNLRAMRTMTDAFGVPVGYSDHTVGNEVSLAAVALGACVIEKHFTLDRSLPGPDHKASLEPAELTALVRGIRVVEQALGHGRKEPTAAEADTARVARKSIIMGRDAQAGTILTMDLLAVKRPGTGLPPAMLNEIVGRTLAEDVKAGTVIDLEMLV
jgi:N,N'-diacetyllegionaminate synthase